MDKLTEDIMVGTSMGKVDDKMMLGTSAYLNITSLCGKAGWQVLSYFFYIYSADFLVVEILVFAFD